MQRVRAARGYGGPREWVLTAALAVAAPGPGTHRREIESREGDNILHAHSTLSYHVGAKQTLIEWRTVQLLHRGDNSRVYGIRPIRGQNAYVGDNVMGPQADTH